MTTYDTSGYAGRLAKALKGGRNPMSVRKLGRELEERFPDMRGANYGGARLYAEGEVKRPRVDLLRAMAEVLGVRPEWLAFDDGEMDEATTEALETREEAAEGAVVDELATARRERALQLKWAVLAGLGFPKPDAPTSWAGQANLGHLPYWLPLLAEVQRRTGQEGERIGRALRGPLVALDPDFDIADEMDDVYRLAPWLDDYIMGMAPVLLSLEGVLADEPGARKWDRRTPGTVKRTRKTEGGDDGQA